MTSRASQLEEKFRRLGVNSSKPEFYNQPAFKAEEQREPRLLEDYSEYVLRRQYSDNYLDTASKLVPKIIAFLFDALVADGRLGACLDASLAASKILEQYGLWNTIQAGSLTIDYVTAKGIETRYWAHVMIPGDSAKVGHAWLVAPPFCLIDFTLSRQPSDERLISTLPKYAIAREKEEKIGVCLNDLMDMDLQQQLLRQYGRLPTIVEFLKHDRTLAAFQRKFPPFAVRDKAATLKYFPCAITAAEEEFDKHTGHCFSGRATDEVFLSLSETIGPPNHFGLN